MNVLKKSEIKQRSGLSASTIWRLEQAGDFPRRLQLAPGRIGWLESDFELWLASRRRVQTKSEAQAAAQQTAPKETCTKPIRYKTEFRDGYLPRRTAPAARTASSRG
jgi:prophage regulatory protein